MIPVLAPALQRGPADAIDTRAIEFKIADEGPIEEALGVVAPDGSVAEVEFELAVNVGDMQQRHIADGVEFEQVGFG